VGLFALSRPPTLAPAGRHLLDRGARTQQPIRNLGRGALLRRQEKNVQTQSRTQQAQAPHLLPNAGLLGTIQIDYDRRGHGTFFRNTGLVHTFRCSK
jgi:hypothetical protein